MSENYMALCVSILAGVSPEKAFALLEGKPVHREPMKKRNKKWSETEIIIMRLLREKGNTWDEVGRQYGISGHRARSLVMYHGAEH